MIAVRKIKHEGGKERSWVSSLEWLVARLTRRAVRSETGENGTAPFQMGRLISLSWSLLRRTKSRIILTCGLENDARICWGFFLITKIY